MPSSKSRAHPKCKTKYRVGNWAGNDRSLVERGNLTVWLSPDLMAQWNVKSSRRRGGQRKYSDLAIQTVLTLRILFQLPLRQAEGFLRSLFDLMGLVLDVPDHTTLSRRGKHLKVSLRVPKKSGRIDLVIDSSGLAIFGEGEWAAVKHGGTGVRGWKKLHLGVDGDGVIVGQVLTDANVDDGNVGVDLVGGVPGKVRSVIGDGAYDSRALYGGTMKARLRRALCATSQWCRGHRHDPIAVQHAALGRQIRGHCAYYGITGNARSLAACRYAVLQIWRKWKRWRSNKARKTWGWWNQLIERYPLPSARVVHSTYRPAASP
ncbi:MAG: hypothetical protein ACJA0V_000320 [Planctomycetota bacterium]|jgi:hypothetical protein